jgi:hypothetical protein
VCDRVVIYYGGRVQAMGTLKDLLTTPDALRITTPALSRETTERVLEIIRRDVAADKVRIDTPTQNLESYFLAVVQRARQAAAETSGAISGATIAAYLRGDAGAQPGPERILERLTAPPVAAPRPVLAPQPAETVDEQKLASLAKSSAPAPLPPQPATASEPPADLEKANEKLSALLGKQE